MPNSLNNALNNIDLSSLGMSMNGAPSGTTTSTTGGNTGPSTAGEQAKNASQTLNVFQNALKSIQGLPALCNKKIAELRSKLTGNAAADQSTQEEIKKTEATLKKSTGTVNKFQALGKCIRDFFTNCMGNGKETATV